MQLAHWETHFTGRKSRLCIVTRDVLQVNQEDGHALKKVASFFHIDDANADVNDHDAGNDSSYDDEHANIVNAVGVGRPTPRPAVPIRYRVGRSNGSGGNGAELTPPVQNATMQNLISSMDGWIPIRLDQAFKGT